MSCASDAECPSPFVCQLSAKRCVSAGHEDVDPPVLLSAVAADTYHVVLEIDEEVDPASVATATYTITPALDVTSKVLAANLREISLEVSAQTAGLSYAVAVTGLTDLFANTMTDATPQTFTGFGAFPDRNPPSIVAPLPTDTSSATTTLLAWTHPALAHSYAVDVATDSNFAAPVPGSPFIIDDPVTSVLVPTPDPVRYYWRVRADTTSPDTYSSSSFDISGDTVYVYCPSSTTTCADDGFAGNISAPLQTLSGALARVRYVGASRLFIAARGGATAYDGSLVVSVGLTVRGGYDATFSEAARDVTANQTVITSAAAPALIILGTGATVSVDGLTLNAPASDAVQVESVDATSSAVIAHCTIDGAVNGVLVRACDPAHPENVRIDSNDIEALLGVGLVTGVQLNNAGATVVGNTIGNVGHGVYADIGSSLVMNGNTILAQLQQGGPPRAIDVEDASLVMRGNIVFGQDGADVMALYVTASTLQGACQIVDNVLVAGQGTSYGSRNYIGCYASEVVIANNVFVAGSGDRSWPVDDGCLTSGSGNISYVNNIFISGSGANSVCFNAHSYASNATDFRNNAFVGCTTALYVANGSTLTAIDDVNDGSNLNSAAPPRSGGNLAFAAVTDLGFAAYATDFHLTSATPSAVRYGGINTSLEICGSSANATCGMVSVDRDGAARTCPTAGQCFSIGAYEQDAP